MYLKALALALTLASPVLAQDLPAPLSDTLSDYSDVLNPTEEGQITRLLTDVRTSTGVQMVVVTMPDIATQGGAGQRIEDYAKRLFNAWGVGDAKRNDGIMLLLDTQNREARLALGAGYDPVYDGRAARVLSTAVLPALHEGRYAAGIEGGILSARERLIEPFLAGTPVTLTDGFEEPASGGSGLGTALMGFGGVAAVAGFGFWRNARAGKICPNCGALTLQRTREIIQQPTRGEPGVAMQHLTCPSCGFTDHKSFPIGYSGDGRMRRFRTGPSFGSRSSGGGSSSGGFGGGRSSGGGASGKW